MTRFPTLSKRCSTLFHINQCHHSIKNSKLGTSLRIEYLAADVALYKAGKIGNDEQLVKKRRH